MSSLTAEEVADRLGVKVETVYSYVSRGALRSWRELGSRRSLFHAQEVETLARRGRPRRTTRPPALDFVIETALTKIGGHDVSYRGRSALELARTSTFEEVAEWLWTGAVAEPTTVPWRAISVELPDLAEARDRLRMAVVLAAAADPLRAHIEHAALVERARSLVATMASAVPVQGEGRSARLALPGRPTPLRGTLAGRLWGRLTRLRPTPGLVRALNAALVLLADHEMAVSTLAARVAASARADLYGAVLAGLGPLAGPLHGGASRLAWDLLEWTEEAGADSALARSLDTYRCLPGFGHPLYPAGDPRARALLELVRAAASGNRQLELCDRLVATARVRGQVEPNVDMALAVLGRVARMPPDAGETIFTIARTGGWIAHAIEEYGEVPLRFRARASVSRQDREL